MDAARRLLGAAAVVLCLALVTTGAFVTAAGPHAGATDRPIERFGDFYARHLGARAGGRVRSRPCS